MKNMLVNPEWPGRVVGATVFILAVFEMLLWFVTKMMIGGDLVDGYLALLAVCLVVVPVVIAIAAGAGLLAWEVTTRLVARLEFSDEEYRRFVSFRSLW